jgi:hypothetical protein
LRSLLSRAATPKCCDHVWSSYSTIAGLLNPILRLRKSVTKVMPRLQQKHSPNGAFTSATTAVGNIIDPTKRSASDFPPSQVPVTHGRVIQIPDRFLPISAPPTANTVDNCGKRGRSNERSMGRSRHSRQNSDRVALSSDALRPQSGSLHINDRCERVHKQPTEL